MTNFSFLQKQWAVFHPTVDEAEKHVYIAPAYTAMLCRRSLEEMVQWLYSNDKSLKIPQHDNSLNTLIHQQQFKDLVAAVNFKNLNLVRKLGNNATHTRLSIATIDALTALRIVHGFAGWIVTLYSEEKIIVPRFDETLIPKGAGKEVSRKTIQENEQQYLVKFKNQNELIKVLQSRLDEFEKRKQQNLTHTPPPLDPNEDVTRNVYIAIQLREAGWDITKPNVIEFPLTGMPKGSGNNGDGFADYVLWGDDNKPLAVIEAKRTSRDARVGQNQAKLYADCLENMYGQRPIIYYTNGFETHIWDDVLYAPRPIYGFHTKAELQTLLNRRIQRKELRDLEANTEICERYYQHRAIKSITTVLEKGGRSALIVMATGTGKTRMAAGLTDLLSKAGWVKRILFLADRNALVHQAKKAFNTYLPNMPAIDLTKETQDESTRIVFSTYQTLINKIDGEWSDGGVRHYGPGHFDLVIFDEIHRSVYNKYRAIFNYFDAYRIGLTATPKVDTDKDTYELFGLQKNDPTDSYELDDAVREKFLNPYRLSEVEGKFQREGVKYDDLSEEEKLEYEEKFGDPVTGGVPEEIESEALNKWLFNKDTVNKILAVVMKNGIKVDGGDKLGKTIIFARSHQHAKFIETQFNEQYPQYKGAFLKVIDNYEEYKYDLLNNFSEKEKLPQIAVSVDMLDTGIDIPEIVNLVFAKPIKSKTKFWQMIGRGTRLCPDLFEPGKSKSEFLIFDFCYNFEFFGQNPKGAENRTQKSLSHRIFETRLKIAHAVYNHCKDESNFEDLKQHADGLIELLKRQVFDLNNDNFIVRQKLRTVEKYKDPHQWNNLTDMEVKEILEDLAPLVVDISSDPTAKHFDLMMLQLQLLMLIGDKRQLKIIENTRMTGAKLSKKYTIPAVAQKKEIIEKIQTKVYWEGMTVPAVDRLREEIRDLIKFIDLEAMSIVYTNFEDEINITNISVFEPGILIINDLEMYRKRIEGMIKEMLSNPVIEKLRKNIPVTKEDIASIENLILSNDELSNTQLFQRAIDGMPLGKFIRSIVGMDISAAKAEFASFIAKYKLNETQIRFIDTIVDYVVANGTITGENLFEPSFTDISDSSIVDLFEKEQIAQLMAVMERINRNALAA